MDKQDPLAQLRDIHLPTDVSWWPLAPGWWLLIILATILVASLVYWAIRWWKSSTHKRIAIKELESVLQQYKQNQNASGYINDFAQIIRRVALVSFPQEKVASLTGQTWLNFLDKSAKTQDFSRGDGQLLAHGPYQQTLELPAASLHKIGVNWIKKHRTI